MIAPAPNGLERSHAPAAYPFQLARVHCLPDGTDVVVRPIHPGDEAIELEFIKGLSRGSGYNRLLSGRRLTPQEIRQLTRIDYDSEMAFIAVHGSAANARMLGAARYVRDADASGAEFALVVADAWQRSGLGALLLRALLRHAQSAGIGRLHGITFATNQAMQNLARKLGFALKPDPQDATVRLVEKTLAPAAPPARCNAGTGRQGAAANDAAGAPRCASFQSGPDAGRAMR